MLFSSRARIRIIFRVWLVSGYAHICILLSVVIVTSPQANNIEKTSLQLKTSSFPRGCPVPVDLTGAEFREFAVGLRTLLEQADHSRHWMPHWFPP